MKEECDLKKNTVFKSQCPSGNLSTLWILKCQQHLTVDGYIQVHELPQSHYGDYQEGLLYLDNAYILHSIYVICMAGLNFTRTLKNV